MGEDGADVAGLEDGGPGDELQTRWHTMEVRTKGQIRLHNLRALESDVTLHAPAVVPRIFHSPEVRTIFGAVNNGSDAMDKLRSTLNCEHTFVNNLTEDWFAIGEPLMHVRTLSSLSPPVSPSISLFSLLICISFHFLSLFISVSLLLFSLLLCGVFFAVLCCVVLCCAVLCCCMWLCYVCVVVCVCWEEEGGRRGVCIEHVSVVYRHHAHMFDTCGRGAGAHRDVLNVHTGVFQRVTPNTPQHHTPTTTMDTHSTQHNTTQHNTTQHNTTTPTHYTHQSYAPKDGEAEPAAQFAPTKENSPGLDTVRIDRLFALFCFYGWCCMAVLLVE